MKLGNAVIEIAQPVIWAGLKLLRIGAQLNGHDVKYKVIPNKFGGVITIHRCMKA